jgi:DNA-3-methyladenine glycosylase
VGGRLAGMTLIPREFFARDAVEVAPDLLGLVLEHQTAAGPVAVRLTEVEAYEGEADPASHAYRGRTQRNAVMYGPPGHAYVYFTYGMHFCVNLVCLGPGTAAAVLLRAGAVIEGEDLARQRRSASSRADIPARDLARGPARICQALGIDKSLNGADVCVAGSPLRVRRENPAARPENIATGPRVGVTDAADVPWRFWIDGASTVSPYRLHTPRKRRRQPIDYP